jgi:hypothetical protein
VKTRALFYQLIGDAQQIRRNLPAGHKR